MLIPQAILNNNGFVFGSWTPTLISGGGTDPTLGAGSIQEGRYAKLGSLVILWGFIKFGTSGVNAGSNNYRIANLPWSFGASFGDGTNSTQGNPVIGTLALWDSSAQVHRGGMVSRWAVEQNAVVGLIDSAATSNLFLSATGPWTWAASDHINFQCMYETDQ